MSPQVIIADASHVDGVGNDFDIDATIAAFLENIAGDFIELPRLSTGQRRQARKLVDQHPELVCESFGFGEERRLHLFKKDSHVVRTRALKIARTVEPMIGDALLEDMSETRVFVEKTILPLSRPLPEEEDETSTDTSASNSRQSSCVSTPSASAIPDMPVRFDVVPFRNTFVHFEESADERQIQSMPHGMFSRIFGEELRRNAPFDAFFVENNIVPRGFAAVEVRTSVVPQVAVTPMVSSVGVSLPNATDPMLLVDEFPVRPGTEVIIQGLLKLPAFNGLTGVVQSFDEEAGRYSVWLPSQVGGHQWAKVKRENLRCSMPPPPSHEPILLSNLHASEDLVDLTWPSTPTIYDEIRSASKLALAALV